MSNLIAVCFYPVRGIVIGVRHVLRGLYYCATHPLEIAVAIKRVFVVTCKTLGAFIEWAIVYVHSERRTLCLVDAAIGASIGYFFGSVIIGALAGSILSVINYEMVSVRWLKIAPAKTKTTN